MLLKGREVQNSFRHRFDDCDDLFSMDWMLAPDDGRARDAGEFDQHGFDPGRVNIIAPADDHVLDSIDDKKAPVGIHPSDIACMHPSVAQDLSGAIGIIDIAAHQAAATNADLAALPCGKGAAVFVENSNLGIAGRSANTAQDSLLRGAVDGGQRRLGHSVGLADGGAESILGAKDNFVGDRRARGKTGMQALGSWACRQDAPACEHRRNGRDKRDLFLDGNLQGLRRVESRREYALRPAENRGQHRGTTPVGMREGQGAQNAVVCPQGQTLSGDDAGMTEQGFLRDAGTFGLPGCSGGIEDHAETAGCDRSGFGLVAGTRELVDADQFDRTPGDSDGLAQDSLTFSVNDHQIAVCMAKSKDQISDRGEDRCRDDCPPGVGDAEPGGRKIEMIVGCQQGSLSGAQSAFPKPHRTSADMPAQFRVGGGAPGGGRAIDESDLLRLLPGGLVDA